MDRRKFIGNSIKACVVSAVSGGMITNALAKSSFLQAISGSCTDKILVLIQMNGGNDGLNTVIPLDQYSLLSSVRSNILIPENKVLTTSKYNATGFHPSATGLHQLFEESKLSVVQGCSYNNPDLSHFRATDIWMTGSDSNEYLKTGWIGRNLDELYPGWPDEYPNDEHPDPLAIQMGSTTALGLEGASASFGIATTNITSDYALLSGFGDPSPSGYAGCYLDYIRTVAVNTDKYNARIVEAANNQKTNMSSLYGSGSVSNQLKNVARLIKGGLQTRVYVVSLSGFDTHAMQIEGDTTSGVHASLLKEISEGVRGFQDDIEKMGVNDRVTGMVFSEFGRRVNSNGSNGTDHGEAMPVMLFGSELKGDMYGTNPNLSNGKGGVVDNVPLQYDYRCVYYSLLKDWFALSNNQLSNVFGGKEYEYIELFKPESICDVISGANTQVDQTTDRLLDVYPTAIDESGIIPFYSSGGDVQLNLYDISGHKISTIMESSVTAGSHRVTIERNNLKSGMYLIEMKTNNNRFTKKMIVN